MSRELSFRVGFLLSNQTIFQFSLLINENMNKKRTIGKKIYYLINIYKNTLCFISLILLPRGTTATTATTTTTTYQSNERSPHFTDFSE